jgi:SPASM domain peptide maturase of grasp-with-spasm system
MSISANGDIKNCPSLQKVFGNLLKDSILTIVKKKEFQKLWHINKDKINICKVCEYRYSCTDCRAFIEEPDNNLSKPLKCGYDPYKGVWLDWKLNKLKVKTFLKYESKI